VQRRGVAEERVVPHEDEVALLEEDDVPVVTVPEKEAEPATV
jgi:hypothetical protein